MNNTDYETPNRERNNLPTITPDGRIIGGLTGQDAPPAPIRIHRSLTRVEEQRNNEEEAAEVAAYMMYGPRSTPVELPELKVEAWPYSPNQRPNPISISKARKLLAAALAAIPCEAPGAGVHGHAWVIETDEDWLQRDGVTTTMIIPTMPVKTNDYSLMAAIKYNDQMGLFKVYNHVMQESKHKIIEWFGKAMFEDLHQNGLLPNTVTAKALLKHLEKTYSQSYDKRQYLEQVEKELNSPYDPKKPVETYFMKLQDVQTNAALLGQPYTPAIIMNKALGQFAKQYGKDAYKAEKKWNEETDRSWTAFKDYWKREIHQWETVTKATRQANQAVYDQVDSLSRKMSDMEINMNSLQAENQSYKEENNALITQQIQFHNALQSEQQRRGGSSSDEISTITDYMNQKFEALNTRITEMSTMNQHTLLNTARQRDPAAYKHMNEGKGRKFNKYCWHCGVNCTHWTRKCYELSDDKKKQYRDADFDNTMGGSTKFMERRGKYQRDYGFDSL